MREHLPWLDQGDIFRDIPVLDVGLREDYSVVPEMPWGPALLVTHGCAIDKRDRQGRLTVERLQFISIRSAQLLEAEQRTNLRGRAKRDDPYDAMWLGELGNLGDCWISLTDPYFLPSTFFDLELRDFTAHEDADLRDPFHAGPKRHDIRMGRIDDEQQRFFRRKLVAFWTRELPDT